MTRIILHGCGGAMGKVIAGLAAEDPGVTIAAGVDVRGGEGSGFPVFTSMDACDVDADCVIDFSTASAVDGLLQACGKKKIPLVLCTTGLSEDQLAKVKETAKNVAVLRSANMSLGINLLLKLVKDAARVLAGAGFDMEILEKHHHRKTDAPSGTALLLADAINEEMEGRYHYCLDRSGRREKRDPMEIGIQAIRGGNIVGEHDVIYAGEDEVITISHAAYSRAIFGKGALAAAKFLASREPGLYSMEDVIG